MLKKIFLLFAFPAIFLISGCVEELDITEPEDILSMEGMGILGENGELEYEAIRLGALNESSGGRGGMNDLGQVVGTSGDYAYIWEDDVMHQLPMPDNTTYCFGFDINNLGEVVGFCSNDDEILPIYWDNTGNPSILDVGDYTSGVAMGVNDGGVIVGIVFVEWDEVTTEQAVFWEDNGANLDFLIPYYDENNSDGRPFSNIALTINNNGYIAGSSYRLEDDVENAGILEDQGVVWLDRSSEDSPEALTDLRVRDANWYFTRSWLKMNDNNDIVGHFYDGGDVVSVWLYQGGGSWHGPNPVDDNAARLNIAIEDRDDNHVRVAGRYSSGGPHVDPAIWSINVGNGDVTAFQILPMPSELSRGGSNFSIWQMNANGWVLGQTSARNQPHQGTIWRPVEDDPVDPDPGDGEMLFVSDIDHRQQGPHLRVAITVVDEFNEPVSGVSVEAVTENSSGDILNASGSTDSDGTFEYRWQHGGGEGPHTTCVNHLEREGYEWDEDDVCVTG